MQYEISKLGNSHEIRSNNVLMCGVTGRVMAVFYNDYDLEELIGQTQEFIAEKDGFRFEAVKSMLHKMSKSDLRLMTDLCLELERKTI